ncbi:phage tail protein, partial [Hafnia paralvei]|uniref:phage tail protein n=1 Tax=Hafnia paralvei TaxID=546367 RepID=UPI002672C25A
ADSFELHGGKYSASSYHTDRPQIVFNDYPDGRENFPTRVIIKDTNSFNCGIAYLLVDGAKSTNYVNISGNLVTTDSLTDSYVSGLGLPDNRAKAYLSIIGESATSVNIGVPRAPMWNISDNSFDTFMQTGYNMDLVKIGGSTLGGSASGNMFRNRNTESFSEVDTFTGGLEVTFTNNRFENISFKLETLKFFTGRPRLGEGGRSVISNNVMHFSKNPLMDYGMWLLSPQVVVNSNVIYYEGADDPLLQRPFTGIYFREGDTIDTPDFGGLPPYACTVSNNTIEIKTGVISKDLRVQTINTSEMEGCTITGNTFFGGNPQVFSNRRANMRNLWTGNYLSSTQFNGNDIYRMQSQMVGAGNYVGSGKNFNNTPAAKVTQDIPAQTNGTTIYVNLAQTFDIPTNETKSLYALTVVTRCPTMLNRQVFLISSGVHDEQEALACLDSRFDRNSNDPAKGQYVFKLQWTSANTMQLVANMPYLSTSTPPTKVEYMITAITANLL